MYKRIVECQLVVQPWKRIHRKTAGIQLRILNMNEANKNNTSSQNLLPNFEYNKSLFRGNFIRTMAIVPKISNPSIGVFFYDEDL